jgi:hypothetical protein
MKLLQMEKKLSTHISNMELFHQVEPGGTSQRYLYYHPTLSSLTTIPPKIITTAICTIHENMRHPDPYIPLQT